jgi:hypothetical protein
MISSRLNGVNIWEGCRVQTTDHASMLSYLYTYMCSLAWCNVSFEECNSSFNIRCFRHKDLAYRRFALRSSSRKELGRRWIIIIMMIIIIIITVPIAVFDNSIVLSVNKFKVAYCALLTEMSFHFILLTVNFYYFLRYFDQLTTLLCFTSHYCVCRCWELQY